jgi:hypothetical protein
MTRASLVSFAVVLALSLIWTEPCSARAGGGGGNRGNQDVPDVPAVSWSESTAEAVDASQKADKPFLIYFCSEEMAKFAGMGSQAVAAYRKTAKPPLPPNTAFESPNCAELVKAYGYSMVKIPATAQNAEVMKKYKVSAVPALIACAPTGEAMQALIGPEQASQTGIIKMLKDLKDLYAAWKKAHPAKDATKAETKAQAVLP